MKIKVNKEAKKVKLTENYGIILREKKEDKNSKNKIITDVLYKEATLSINAPINIVFLKSSQILRIKKIALNGKDFLLCGEIVNIKNQSYIYPLSSICLNIFEVNVQNSVTTESRFCLTDINCKGFLVYVKDSYMKEPKIHAFPLLHGDGE